jgi:pimeloyl-ACP methyl ester carboxylesterase
VSRRSKFVALGLAVIVVLLVIPPGRTWAKAGVLAADALGIPVPRPLAHEVERRPTDLGGIEGDVYDPGYDAPTVLLVPGATPPGRDDRRVVQVATALAGSGRTVFVPELELYEEEVVRRDVARLVDSTAALAERSEADHVVIAGISYGGSLSVIAAADRLVADRVRTVAIFGSYADLFGVLQAITTGVSLVEGEEIDWPDPHPDAKEVLRDEVIGLLPDGQGDLLAAAIDGDVDPEEIPEPAATLHRLLDNDDPERTYEIVDDLPEIVRVRLDRLSPVHVLDDLAAHLVVMHATDDPLVPYGEAVRFTAHHPDAELFTLTSFGHVDVDATSPRDWVEAAGDLRHVWRFAHRVLAPDEPLVPRRLTPGS